VSSSAHFEGEPRLFGAWHPRRSARGRFYFL